MHVQLCWDSVTVDGSDRCDEVLEVRLWNWWWVKVGDWVIVAAMFRELCLSRAGSAGVDAALPTVELPPYSLCCCWMHCLIVRTVVNFCWADLYCKEMMMQCVLTRTCMWLSCDGIQHYSVYDQSWRNTYWLLSRYLVHLSNLEPELYCSLHIFVTPV